MTENTHTFTDLGVAEPIVAALAETGICNPFPIQELAIPIALTGADMIGQARTGTGKTLAFGAPLLQRLHCRPMSRLECGWYPTGYALWRRQSFRCRCPWQIRRN